MTSSTTTDKLNEQQLDRDCTGIDATLTSVIRRY